MSNQIHSNIFISIDQGRMSAFFPFLQKGAQIKVKVGCSIKAMLSGQFGVNADYIENRIKTLFLNSHPVDDIESAIIQDGDTLALAAAMPGLAGATFRKGGNLASFRSTISYRQQAEQVKRQNGIIVIKLFNLVIRELGPTFLKSGILVTHEELLEFFNRQPEMLWKTCTSVKIDGNNVPVEALRSLTIPGYSEHLLLCVVSA